MVFWIWGSLFVLTVIAEIASQQLISIWFAGCLTCSTLRCTYLVASIAVYCSICPAADSDTSAGAEIHQFRFPRYQFAVGFGKIRHGCANHRCRKRNGQSAGR